MSRDSKRRSIGTVYLVGAGPGDPGLITQRGLQLIKSADVIFYDHLAPLSLLNAAPTRTKKVYVGKKRARHVKTQEQINEMLVTEARAGKSVVRLKGGDPYMFGRGGEEAEALWEAGVPFELAPGVTSPLGVAAYAGIPLTHRNLTSSVVFVTGHEPNGIDWARLGVTGTLVIFMGLTTFSEIASRLIESGRPPTTPAAAVRWGTRGDQRTIVGTVENLADKIAKNGLKPPALIVVGEVVSLREKLDWFEKKPLFGQTVVITRAREQAAGLSQQLRALGANAVELPTIEIRPPESWDLLDAAVARIASYDWVIFTSANGVRHFVERLDASSRDLRSLRAKICAIGPATSLALRQIHLKVDSMPEEYVAESVLASLAREDLRDNTILLPRAQVARDVIPVELEKRGAKVEVVPAYRTVIPKDAARQADQCFAGSAKPDWITFTSSSTVANFARICPIESLDGVRVASIGPITSATARRLGLSVDVEAEDYTIEGLLDALVKASQTVFA